MEWNTHEVVHEPATWGLSVVFDIVRDDLRNIKLTVALLAKQPTMGQSNKSISIPNRGTRCKCA